MMTEKKTKTALKLQKRPLIQCPSDCDGGVISGLFHQMDCDQCNGLGMLDETTGEALPDREVIRHLQARLLEEKERIRVLVDQLQGLERKIPMSERVYPEGSIKD